MTDLIEAVLCVGIPFGAAMVIYYFADKSGDKTLGLLKKFEFVLKHKLAFQFAATIVFVAAFGLICGAASLPVEIFYVICGAYVGTINGCSAALMRKE